jgi:hypothetical protein
MKLHELDWTDGKRYDVVIDEWNKVEVVVRGYNLRVNDQNSLTDMYNIGHIVTAEFTEIIEEVTFLEAYQDCLAHGYKYKTEAYGIKANMHRNIDGNVQLMTYNTNMPLGAIKWTRIK